MNCRHCQRAIATWPNGLWYHVDTGSHWCFITDTTIDRARRYLTATP